ncbi:TPA: hypothetical protein ACXK4S_000674 [Pseudomonas aeruginosa]
MINDKAPSLKDLKAKKKKLENQAAAIKDLIVQLVLAENTEEVNQQKRSLESTNQKLAEVSEDIRNINRLVKRDVNDRFISSIQRKFRFTDNDILESFLNENSVAFASFIANVKNTKSTSEQEENE